MGKKYVIITADTNDADYITEKTEVSDKTIELLKPIAEAIKNCKKRHNWPNHEYVDDCLDFLYEGILTEDQIELFNSLCPSSEYGIHTIKNIEILVVEEEYSLL